MHRGHSWVFRAETYDTMLAWFDDIKVLTEATSEERNAYVRGHSRSFSTNSARSVSSFDDDEADTIPFNSNRASMVSGLNGEASGYGGQESKQAQRPQPGGRFPSDLQIRRDGAVRGLTPSSDDSEVNQSMASDAGEIAYPNSPLATASHINGESSISHATRRGPAYDTPAPIVVASPRAHQAEYDTTTPIHSYAPTSPLTTSFQQSYEPPAQTIVSSGTSAPHTMSPPEQMAAVESNAWLHATESPSQADGVTNSRPQTAKRDFVEVQNEDKAAASAKQDMPNIRRMDTGNSVSNLHVPGEYPRGAQP
jgi:hypothetical protein